LTTKVSSASVIEHELWQAFDRRDQAKINECANKLTTIFARYDSGWYSLSQIAYKQKNIKSAFKLIAEAIKLKPDNAVYLLHQVMLISAIGDYDEAKRFMAKVDDRQLKTAYQFATAGRIYSAIEQQSKALNCYQRAVDLEPLDAGHHYNLAAVARFTGDMTLAKKSLDVCLKINRDDAQAAYLLSQLPLTDDQIDQHIALLSRQFDGKAPSPRDRVYNQFALGALYEKGGNYKDAFWCFDKANKTRREHINYSIEHDLELLNQIMIHANDDDFHAVRPSSSEAEPIFLLGLPRTGSTLIERAITNDTGVYSAGEPNSFNLAMQREASAVLGRRCKDAAELLATVKDFNFDRLADTYMQSYNALPSNYSTHLDKLPMNSLNLAVIAKTFPNAKLIYLDRNPADTLYAIYKTLFEDAYPFSYNIDELARYILMHRNLMSVMKRKIGSRLLVLRYEDFILDNENELRRLANYLDLPVSKLSNFQENTQASSTASSTQVRQPIHDKSVGLYRQVESQLRDGLKVLEEEVLTYYG